MIEPETFQEGFICPICVTDCYTSERLLEHFQSQHNNENSERQYHDLKFDIKALLGKTKTLFLKESSSSGSRGANHGGGSGHSGRQQQQQQQQQQQKLAYYEDPNSFQAPGCTRVLTRQFKEARLAKMTSKEAQTNKLLLRLDKLIGEGPTDPKLRKEFEQSVVYWAPDADVPLCPHCGQRFLPLARRRHHCRLCGAVLCAACSVFLPYRLARLLTAPPADEGDAEQRDSAATAAAEPSSMAGLGFIQRSGSESSLHSLLTAAVVGVGVGGGGGGSAREALVIRVCPDCRDCLEFRRHRAAARQRLAAAPINELYGQLSSAMRRAADQLAEYEPMAASLRRGEDSFNLAHVSEMRLQIRQLLDQIDAVSLRIAGLSSARPGAAPNPDDDEAAAAGLQQQRQHQLAKEARVERAIRAYAVAFVRDGLLTVACLPTPEQLRQLRAQRAERQRREAEAAAAARRAAAPLAPPATPPPPPPPPPPGAFIASTSAAARRRRPPGGAANRAGDGIDGYEGGADDDEPDPLREQIANLRDFIQQARQAGRADELRALEANLAELLAELHSRQEAERRRANSAAAAAAAAKPSPSNPFEADAAAERRAPVKQQQQQQQRPAKPTKTSTNPFEVENDTADYRGVNPFD